MTITLNGREYPLRFSVNALCCLEEKTGRGLSSLQSDRLSCIRALLWCGLMESEKGLTLEGAGELLDAHLRAGGSLSQVSAILSEALSDACFFPKPGAEAAANP